MIIIYAFLIPLALLIGLFLPLALVVRGKLNAVIRKQYEEKLRAEQAAEERRKEREEMQRKRAEELRETSRKHQEELVEKAKKLQEITAEKKEKARLERIKRDEEVRQMEQRRLQEVFDMTMTQEDRDSILAKTQAGTEKYFQAIRDYMNAAEKKEEATRQAKTNKIIENEREIIKQRMKKHNIKILDKWAP